MTTKRIKTAAGQDLLEIIPAAPTVAPWTGGQRQRLDRLNVTAGVRLVATVGPGCARAVNVRLTDTAGRIVAEATDPDQATAFHQAVTAATYRIMT